MEQALATMREELEHEVQELSKSRSIEDRAARMAKEVEVSKVCVGREHRPLRNAGAPLCWRTSLRISIRSAPASQPGISFAIWNENVAPARSVMYYRNFSRISQKASPSVRTHHKAQEHVA